MTEEESKMQRPLTHEGAEPDTDHDTHGVADEQATVLQPDGEEIGDTVERVEIEQPKEK